MKLGYKYYRDSFIKFAILSIALVGVFWDWFHGKSQESSRVILFMAVLMIAGNVGLFLAMRSAKRREAREQLMNRMAPLPSYSPVECARLFTEALRKRKKVRLFIECWFIGGGLLFMTFGRSSLIEGIPAFWMGCLLIALGILGLLGVNVFRGGPLDLRLDHEENLPISGNRRR